MAIAEFPEELSCFTRDDLSRTLRDGRLKTEPERGRPFFRGGSDAAPELVSGSKIVKRTLLAVLEQFYYETTDKGSLPFYVRDQIYDGAPLYDENDVPLLDENDLPLLDTQTWLAQFAAPPVIRRIAPKKWQYTLNLLVL